MADVAQHRRPEDSKRFTSFRTTILRRGLPVWPITLLWTVAWGLWGLSQQHSVWRDEAATWQVARRSVTDIWHLLGHVDAVHGLYYLLMHELFGWFGPSTTTLRLPSVLATAVAAAFVTLIGHRLAGVWAGLAGGLVFGLIPSVQFNLQEGRPHALIAAGAGLSTLQPVEQSAHRDGDRVRRPQLPVALSLQSGYQQRPRTC
ncbi:hypothetical protein GCM10010377_82490 [Streptomyces viridiviolaceus]|nr:hypothetical protein [Streptomyces viridiviolaceus]GHB80091.1 hypothetical protein GCM10010377_82490 [Streptomyces viridiviolaceus]